MNQTIERPAVATAETGETAADPFAAFADVGALWRGAIRPRPAHACPFAFATAMRFVEHSVYDAA